jgi:hypothetical protein
VTTSLVPARTASWVPATEPTPTASATGSRCTPVDSGPYPRMNWKYWVIRKMKPSRVKNATVTAPLAALNRRLRNSRTSSIGCRERCSPMMNAASNAAETANPATLRALPHP